jgi:hypothetical protein
MGTDISVNYKFARRAAIHAWTEVYGSVSLVCIWQAKRTEEHERSKKAIGRLCGTGDNKNAGCTRTYDQFSAQFVDAKIYILEDLEPEQKLWTAVHEYVHILGNCQSWDQDQRHERKKWWIDNSGNKSIEAIARKKATSLYYKSLDEEQHQDAGSLNDTI